MYPMDEVDPYAVDEPSTGKVLKKATKKSAGGALTQSTEQPRSSALPNTVEALLGKAGGYEAKGMELQARDPDTSAMQEYARQRSQQGNSAMLNALAAQYAGESFQPVQAQFLKKALAAQDPIKLGSGMITPEGKFIRDEEAAQQKQAEYYLTLAKNYQTLAVTAKTAEEKADATRAANEALAQHRQVMEGLAAQSNAIRASNAEAARGNQQAIADARTWRAEDTLRGDFEKLTKSAREELDATNKVTSLIQSMPPGQKLDSQSQQAIVFMLNKFLDPGSVVREGEFDRVVKLQGLEDRARNLYDRIRAGQILAPATIQQINGLAQFYQQAADAKIRKEAGNIGQVARTRGLNVESVIADPRYRGGSPSPSQGGGRNVQVDF